MNYFQFSKTVPLLGLGFRGPHPKGKTCITVLSAVLQGSRDTAWLGKEQLSLCFDFEKFWGTVMPIATQNPKYRSRVCFSVGATQRERDIQ